MDDKLLGLIKHVYRKLPPSFRQHAGPIISSVRLSLRLFINRVRKPTSLNLGGGPYFFEPGWLNLDEVASNINRHPFRLTPDCTFPVANASIHTVYTSHTLEHLDTATGFRVLSETYRVLKDNGRFIIKIPDFDRALDCWKRRDDSFLTHALWGYNSITDTWKSRGICDCLDHRAAMLFCGFWDDEYGDHFSGRISRNECGYHGPPVVGIEFLRKVVTNHTPSQISAELRKFVVENEKNFHFNHQNAWSRQELETLLASAGFHVRSFDKIAIITDCADIPGIDSMKEQSTYCWAEKHEVLDGKPD